MTDPATTDHAFSQQVFLPVPHLWKITMLGITATLLWDITGLDLWLVSLLADSHGFGLRHQWWLETLLHDMTRHLATLAYLLLLLMVWRPVGVFRRLALVQRVEAMAGITLGLLAIAWIKKNSLTSCPWDLQMFGGIAQYTSHWAWGVSDGGSAHCFPGGHASAALGYLALALPWLTSPATADQRLGWRIFWLVLLAGLVLGLTQTLRGAHYPSHTLWTGLICWMAALFNHQAFVLVQRGKLAWSASA